MRRASAVFRISSGPRRLQGVPRRLAQADRVLRPAGDDNVARTSLSASTSMTGFGQCDLKTGGPFSTDSVEKTRIPEAMKKLQALCRFDPFGHEGEA